MEQAILLPVTRLTVLRATSSALGVLVAHPDASEPWGQVRELYNILDASAKMLAEVRQVERVHLAHAVSYLVMAEDQLRKAWAVAAPGGGRFHCIDGRCLPGAAATTPFGTVAE